MFWFFVLVKSLGTVACAGCVFIGLMEGWTQASDSRQIANDPSEAATLRSKAYLGLGGALICLVIGIWLVLSLFHSF